MMAGGFGGSLLVGEVGFRRGEGGLRFCRRRGFGRQRRKKKRRAFGARQEWATLGHFAKYPCVRLGAWGAAGGRDVECWILNGGCRSESAAGAAVLNGEC